MGRIGGYLREARWALMFGVSLFDLITNKKAWFMKEFGKLWILEKISHLLTDMREQ